MRFLIDIDGTILTQQKPGEYDKAVPIEGAIEAVNAMYDAGHQVVFYTSRNFKFMRQTHESLKAFGFKFHHISFGKPHGDIVIDDRAFDFAGWEDAKPKIEKKMKDVQADQEKYRQQRGK